MVVGRVGCGVLWTMRTNGERREEGQDRKSGGWRRSTRRETRRKVTGAEKGRGQKRKEKKEMKAEKDDAKGNE